MKDRIKKILIKVFELQDIPDTISRNNCEKWDSLKHLFLIMELESEFGISIEPEDIIKMDSLANIETVLTTLLSKQK